MSKIMRYPIFSTPNVDELTLRKEILYRPDLH
jgi:hypothetical protein